MGNLRFGGIAGLEVDKSNSEHPRYYVVLEGNFSSKANLRYESGGEVRGIRIRISREEYDALIQEFKAPAEGQRVAVSGELEVKAR